MEFPSGAVKKRAKEVSTLPNFMNERHQISQLRMLSADRGGPQQEVSRVDASFGPGNAGKFGAVPSTPRRKCRTSSIPLTCLNLWTAQITRRRCELCLPVSLRDKAGGLKNTALAGAGEQKHQWTKHPSDKGWIPRRPRHRAEEVYTKLQLWSWTFYQLLTHTCLRDAGEKLRVCLSTSAGFCPIDAATTLNPPPAVNSAPNLCKMPV